ncbi:MAG: GNAT family N-acetyltransferase [Prevotella sp.]|nr:GNAT family N-acetyltransferase [Prevotella sp.]
MNGLKTTIYLESKQVPELPGTNFFHSKKLMEICEQTHHQKPYMVVLSDSDGNVVSHLLGIMRIRTLWFPPFLIIHCRVLGEGVYSETPYSKEELFGEMLGTLTKKLSNRTLFIEVSHLSQKMLGYKQLRIQKFYPVSWMSIHNSLHSHAPEERISEKMLHRINHAHEKGVHTEVVRNEEDLKSFMALLRHHHFLKPKRYIPDETFFRQFMDCDNGKLFVTKYHEHVIGCSACAYSQGNAYLWYSAFKRKSYAMVHPDILTIWDTMKDAYDHGYQHMNFMDVGLPFTKNPFREFILRFGGKEQSTYRWFRFSIKWVNALLAWIYRE